MEGEEEIALLNHPTKLEEEEEEVYVSHNLPPTPRDQLLKKIKPLYFGIAAGFLILLLSFTASGSSNSNNGNNYCRWKFEAYEPSPYEASLSGNVKEWQDRVCAMLMETKHAAASRSIVERSLELYNIDKNVTWERDAKTNTGYVAKSDDYFSRMTYSRECYDATSGGSWIRVVGKGQQLIEPLWGMLRDPFDIWCNSQKLHWSEWPSAGVSGQVRKLPHIIKCIMYLYFLF